MARRPDPEKRDRIVRTTRDLLRRRGVAGTTMLEVVAEAGASRGSLYHYFPGGRSEMVEDAVRGAVEEYTAGIELLAAMDPVEAIPLIVEVWRAEAEASGYTAGCPVVAAALGGESEPAAREIAGRAFADWTDAVSRMLTGAGVPASRAEPLATLALSAIEGAVVIALAQRSSEPLERVARELVTLVEAEVQR
ncbi:TetR/AcrR family transcriptional regulator [Nocardioides immobilis]|uniref:TetR/AcrR family transcriptional regulator n=1 Tax=Nocardioides immobilis TaxID=2049295 RepID=A0A417XWK2_9ACTN|nr:TetR/AcrR family transcriptional regulator [Nocardioides immobilis]RHW24640.1 TetR/AcrR family transcriptional regulator [Nocardioides immobilis]